MANRSVSGLARPWGALVGLFMALAGAGAAGAQQAGTIHGTVTAAESGAPLSGVRIHVEGTTAGTFSDGEGEFRLQVPGGSRVVVFERLGRARHRVDVDVRPGAAVRVDASLREEALTVDRVVVSTTREARDLSATPASVGVVNADALRSRRAAHPSELLGAVPGVHVNVTGGEGHMAAIRQPLTTDPVYLYLEDGVPIRSTGFFNHNALYEVNLPQADRVEVVKGPSSALYGSDAIGGTIDVSTRPAAAAPGLLLTGEAGSAGYGRLLASYGLAGQRHGIRADVNLTRSDGWRDGTAYDRQSGTLRWDHARAGGAGLKTVASFSRINQQTAGSSRLPEAVYSEDPEVNLTPISFRDVLSARLSTEWERSGASSLVTLTAFGRYNAMELLPNWSLSYDPALWETSNASLGVLAKARRDLNLWDTRLVAGVDVDWSPGRHFERRVEPIREGATFVDYQVGDILYDYDVAFTGISPYLHAETSPLPGVHVTGGLRFDRLAYEYDNHLGVLQTGPARRPADTAVTYYHISPKLGASVELGFGASAYGAYSHGFRAPSQGQLFRQGPAEGTVDLEPVEAVSRELGIRGRMGGRLRYELAGYHMTKHNDILAYQRPDDTRETRNAGKTLHRGVELGVAVALPADLFLEAAWSWTRHTFEAWAPAENVDYSGQEMENAPRTIGNTSLAWRPGASESGVTLEWVHVGRYFLDSRNEHRYPGHDLLNLRAQLPLRDDLLLFAMASNLTDRRYAESAGWSAFRGEEYAPGQPRWFRVGAELTMRGER